MRRKVPVHTRQYQGDYYTPRAVAQCLASLLDPCQGSVYDPCCGSGALLWAAQQQGKGQLKLYGQTQDQESFLLSQINLILHGTHADLGREAANTLTNDLHKHRTFDYILANPPFHLRDWFQDHSVFQDQRWLFCVPPRSNANFAWLQHIFSHMNSNGRAAVILPNGTLTTETYREAAIREAIAQSRRIEAVISLPPGLFYGTKVPCCIWLLANREPPVEKILFVDAQRMEPRPGREFTSVHAQVLKDLVSRHRRGELGTRTSWYAAASLEEAARNGWVLSPNLYTEVSRPGEASLQKGWLRLQRVMEELSSLPADERLSAVLEQWKNRIPGGCWKKALLPELFWIFGGVAKQKQAFGRGIPVLDVKTVIRSPYVPDALSSLVEVDQEEQERYSIKRGDVFLNRTSETIQELA